MGQLVDPTAVRIIYATQNGDGGWGRAPDEPSNAHTTGLAALTLVYDASGRDSYPLFP